MFKVQYIVDDFLSTNQNDKCDLCMYKNIVVTKCCQKKLCDFHVRNNGVHADQEYHSCNQCETKNAYSSHFELHPLKEGETTSPIEENGYILNYITVYCGNHNNMNFCAKCECYTCELHLVHECDEIIEINN
jgi:hypothetical protein